MRKFLASLALLMISAEFCAVTTAAESPQPMPRGSARIIGLVVPDFPDKLVREGSSLEIPLSLAVDDDGHVTEVVLESSPSTIDAAIRNAVSHWFVIPAICSDSKWTSKTVRTRIVFSLEEGKQIVTLKDPRWYAIGPDEVLPGAGTGNPSSSTIKMRQPLAKPEFPREAMRRGIDKGVVAAVI